MMKRGTFRNRLEVARARRRSDSQQGSVTQVVFTLFLSFVPFAAVVAVLVALKDPKLLHVLQLMSKAFSELQADVIEYRELLGAEVDTPRRVIADRIRMAMQFQGKAEEAHLSAMRDEDYAWSIKGGKSLTFGSSEELPLIASLSQTNRVMAIDQHIRRWIAVKLEISPASLTPETGKAIGKVADSKARVRVDELFRKYLEGIEVPAIIVQNDVLSDATGTLRPAGEERFKAEVRKEVGRAFVDPPRSGSLSEELSQVFDRIRQAQIARLKIEAAEIGNRFEVMARDGVEKVDDFSAELRAEKEKAISDKLLASLSGDELGPLTMAQAQLVASNAYNEQAKAVKAQISEKLDAILLPKTDIAGLQAQVRSDSKAVRDQLVANYQSQLGDLAHFIDAFPDLQAKRNSLVEKLVNDLRVHEKNRIAKQIQDQDSNIQKVARLDPSLLAQIANSGEDVQLIQLKKVEAFQELIEEAETFLDSDLSLLTETERLMYEQRVLNVARNVALAGKEAALQEAGTIPLDFEKADPHLQDLSDPQKMANRLWDSIKAENHSFLAYSEAQQVVIRRVYEFVDERSKNVIQELTAYFRSRIESLTDSLDIDLLPEEGDSRSKMVDEIIGQSYATSDAIPSASYMKGKFEDIPAPIKNSARKLLLANLSQREIPREISRLTEADLPDHPRETDEDSIGKIFNELRARIDQDLGSPIWLPEHLTEFKRVVAALQSSRFVRIRTKEFAQANSARESFQIKMNDNAESALKSRESKREAFERTVQEFLAFTGLRKPLKDTVSHCVGLLRAEFDRKYDQWNSSREDLINLMALATGNPITSIPVETVASPEEQSGAGVDSLEREKQKWRGIIAGQERSMLVRESITELNWNPEWFTEFGFSSFRMDDAVEQLNLTVRKRFAVQQGTNKFKFLLDVHLVPVKKDSEESALLLNEANRIAKLASDEVDVFMKSNAAKKQLDLFRESFWTGERSLTNWNSIFESRDRIKALADQVSERIIN